MMKLLLIAVTAATVLGQLPDQPDYNNGGYAQGRYTPSGQSTPKYYEVDYNATPAPAPYPDPNPSENPAVYPEPEKTTTYSPAAVPTPGYVSTPEPVYTTTPVPYVSTPAPYVPTPAPYVPTPAPYDNPAGVPQPPTDLTGITGLYIND